MIVTTILLIVGWIVGVFVNAQLLLPLIYGLPKSIIFFLKGQVKFSAILSQLISPIIWVAIIFIFLAITGSYAPTIFNLVFDGAFILGYLFSILTLIFNMFTIKGREDMKRDYFDSTYMPYRTNTLKKIQQEAVQEVLDKYSHPRKQNSTEPKK